MHRLLLIVFLCLSFTAELKAQDLTWESRPAIPNFGREGHAGFMINGKLYVGLGFDANGNYLNDFWEYNPSNQHWTRKANFPGGNRLSPISFSIRGKGYVGMGLNDQTGIYYDDLYQYNPETDSWDRKANFISGGRIAATAIVVDNVAYVGLGSCGNPSCYGQDWYKYVPATNSWTQLANWPGPKISGAMAFSINNNVYVGIGLYADYVNNNAFYSYNTTTNTWASIPDLPGQARRTGGTFTYNGEGYVGCGTYSGIPATNQLNDFYKYDAITNSWSSVTVNDGFAACTNILFFNSGDSVVLGVGGATIYAKLANVWQLKINDEPCTVYDTTYLTLYDTLYTSVNDTLNIYLSDPNASGCGDFIGKIYPNPTSETLYFYSNKPNCFVGAELEIVDQLGRILQTIPYDSTLIAKDIKGYARELYFLRLKSATGDTIFTKKFVIHD